MSKPDWKDAPEWANYLAQDESLEWHWYKNRPRRVGSIWATRGQYIIAQPIGDWRKSLEKRPQQ